MNNGSIQGWVLKHISKTLAENRDYYYKLSEQSDRIVVWLVGFSLASIALVLSNQTELDKLLPNSAKVVLIFGTITTITGIVYRIFLYVAQNLEIQMFIAFNSYIEGFTNPNSPEIYTGREITENHTYDEIVEFLKVDFEVNVAKVDTSNLSELEQRDLRLSVLEQYTSLCNWHEEQLSVEIEGIKDVINKYLGYSKSKLNRIFGGIEPKIKVPTMYWVFWYISVLMFMLCCTVFSTGVVYFLIKFLSVNV